MTVTYTGEVATCRGLGCFLKLLARWKGSIYKLVWMDLIIFLLIYYSLNLTYRLVLDKPSQEIFENVQKYCYDFGSLIPLSFVLGFYVSVVMTRWWSQYTAIPFPDPLAVFVSATVHGQDERGRVMRRTIMRYVCLCVTMTFTMISPRVKKRFPTLDHFVEAGLLHRSEKEIMDDLNVKFPKYSKHWLPIVWASSIITRARKEGRIRDDFAVKTLIDELNKFRGKCSLLLGYDNISIPLVYTQVVTLAVYSYFATALMGHQWVLNSKYKLDFYFPVFTMLQFFFYVGWLKVAESLINPFGDDDDDFEVNWMVDRNLQVSYLIVDEMHHDHPELVRDQYWDEVFPQELPYTVAAAQAESMRNTHPLPSTANIAVKPDDQGLITPSSLKIDGFQSYAENMQSGPIMFSAKQQSFKSRKGSKNSLMGASVPDNMPRVSSVTSVLKRLFSKDDSKAEGAQDSHELNSLVSTSGLKYGGSTKRMTDDVIEEVDEQTTITSQKSARESRPTVMNVFGPPPPSLPINVPHSASYTNQDDSPILFIPYPPLSQSTPSIHDTDVPEITTENAQDSVIYHKSDRISIDSEYAEHDKNSSRNVYDPFPPMSRSAPSTDPMGTGDDTIDHDHDIMDHDRVSIGSETDDEDDEFENLRKQREEERLSRLKLNLARSTSIRPEDIETEVRRRSSTVSTPQSPFPPS